MGRDAINDARCVVVRDPGFACWILVRHLRMRLRRACIWCRRERARRMAVRILARAQAGLTTAPGVLS